ncbi:MAG TPA: hypothetical protein ENK62_06615, partial [Chromatiales bacterium]|nr:hypothetical protein [Chromatiales bacterium]
MARANLDIRLRIKDDGSVVVTRTTRRLRQMGDAGVSAAKRMDAAWKRVAGTMATLFAGYKLTQLASETLSYADSIAKVAGKVGLSTEALQELRYAAEQAGVGTNVLDMAMQRFSRRLGEAAQGKGELVAVLRQYGVEVTDTQGRTRALEDVLADLADAMRDAESDQKRLRIAFKAFDSEGAALVNMLKNGGSALDAMRARGRALGLVMDQDLIKRAERLNDRLSELRASLKVRFGESLLELAPVIEEIVDDLLKWTREVDMRAWGEDAREVLTDIKPYFEDIGVLAHFAAKGFADLLSIPGSQKRFWAAIKGGELSFLEWVTSSKEELDALL